MRRAIAANHGGNADAAEIFAPNFVSHMGGQPPMNRETFEDTLSGFAGGFPGYTFEIEDQIADGDLVVNRITWRGSSPARFARPFRSETLRLIGVRRIHPTEGSPMATHATGTANLAAFHPVQLTLQLCSQRPGSLRAARPRLAYWERVDLADVGGDLQARNQAVRVLLAAQAEGGGAWTGWLLRRPIFLRHGH